MKFKMLKTDMTSIDNFTLKKFFKGEEYDKRETCASTLIARGSAVSLEPESNPAAQALGKLMDYWANGGKTINKGDNNETK